MSSHVLWGDPAISVISADVTLLSVRSEADVKTALLGDPSDALFRDAVKSRLIFAHLNKNFLFREYVQRENVGVFRNHRETTELIL